MLAATEKIEFNSPINIGTSEITKIIDAVKTVCEITGHQPSEFFCDTSKPEGVFARAASTSKRQALLNWEPSTSFEVGIAKPSSITKKTPLTNEFETISPTNFLIGDPDACFNQLNNNEFCLLSAIVLIISFVFHYINGYHLKVSTAFLNSRCEYGVGNKTSPRLDFLLALTAAALLIAHT